MCAARCCGSLTRTSILGPHRRHAPARFLDDDPYDARPRPDSSGDRGVRGAQGDHTPKNPTEQSYIAGTPERIEQLRAQVATSALNAMTVHLGSLGQRGRKTLVVVTEGLPSSSAAEVSSRFRPIDGVIRSANRVNVADLCRRSASTADRQRGDRGRGHSAVLGSFHWRADIASRRSPGRHAADRRGFKRALPPVVSPWPSRRQRVS